MYACCRGVACGEGGRQSPEGSGSSTVQLHLNMQDVHVAGTFSEWQVGRACMGRG